MLTWEASQCTMGNKGKVRRANLGSCHQWGCYVDMIRCHVPPSQTLLQAVSNRSSKTFIENTVPEFLARAFGLFLQDNAPCYNAKIVQKWFEEHNNEFEELVWPSNFPDLNPTFCGFWTLSLNGSGLYWQQKADQQWWCMPDNCMLWFKTLQ